METAGKVLTQRENEMDDCMSPIIKEFSRKGLLKGKRNNLGDCRKTHGNLTLMP